MNEAAFWAIACVTLAAIVGGYIGTWLYHFRNADISDPDRIPLDHDPLPAVGPDRSALMVCPCCQGTGKLVEYDGKRTTVNICTHCQGLGSMYDYEVDHDRMGPVDSLGDRR